MKRVIIIILLILAILVGYNVIFNGITNTNGEVLVSSYKQIESASTSLASDIAVYNTLNDTQYNTLLKSLNETREEYEEAKEEYEELIEEIEEITGTDVTTGDEIVYASQLYVYEIDFLWTIIGNYAKTEGTTITMDVNNSSVSVSESSGYKYYNLLFSVSGEYIDIANFLYDIEDDDRLEFEIRDFYMTSGTATFTVYGVPIASDTLLSTSTSTSTTSTSEEETTDNTVGNETISSNETNTENTTNTTNSVYTSNNTTN